MTSVTVHGMDELIAALRSADRQALPQGKKVVSKGSLNVKKDWAGRWQGLAHAPALPRAVTYDLDTAGDVVSGEIGPDKSRRQGSLGNLLEFGSMNNAPHPGGLPALEAEEPRFVENVGDLGVKLLDD